MLSLESQIKTAADNAQNRFGKDIITDRYEFRGDITLTVARQAVADVVRCYGIPPGLICWLTFLPWTIWGKAPALKSTTR